MMMKKAGFLSHVLLIILFVLITAACFFSPGQGDVKFWLKWMHVLDDHGPFQGFQSIQWDYPPLVSIVLFLTAKMAHLFALEFFTALKLSLTLFLALTSLIVWLWTRDLFITAVLHLSLLLNSILLVYIDIFFAPPLLLSLWAIRERRMAIFTIFYTIACLIKWQPIIIAPFLLLYILNINKLVEWRKIQVRELLTGIAFPLAMMVFITFLLFKMAFLKSFTSALNEVHLSGNALNFGWIMTYFLHVFFPGVFGPLVEGRADYIITGSQKIMLIPKVLFFFFYATTFLSFFKQEKNFERLVYYSIAGFLAYYTFNTGVHENHLFIPVALVAILFFLDKDYISISAYIVIMSSVNMIIFCGTDGKGLGFSRVVGVDVTLLLSALNVLFFLVIWKRSLFPDGNNLV